LTWFAGGTDSPWKGEGPCSTVAQFFSAWPPRPQHCRCSGLSPAIRNGCFSSELYNKGTTTLSPRALNLDGTPVEIVGFMAPPLKAESPFFVLTDVPMLTCPFCDEIAYWPDNIIYVTSNQELPIVPYNRQIRVAGTLSVGEAKDEATGFVSLVRLQNAAVIRS
jgi:hypothetical protein